MEVLNIIEKTIVYRALFQEESDTYKNATITICFLVETFLPMQLWSDYKEFKPKMDITKANVQILANYISNH